MRGPDRVLGKWTTATFLETSASGKTDIWAIHAVADGTPLGRVCWYGSWRQYVFFPADHTLWNPDCLNEVSRFVVKCTVDHRVAARQPSTRGV
jgi:hypothetical protein